jgi:hypothetical protein
MDESRSPWRAILSHVRHQTSRGEWDFSMELFWGGWSLRFGSGLLIDYLSPARRYLLPAPRLPITCHRPEPTPPISSHLTPMGGETLIRQAKPSLIVVS